MEKAIAVLNEMEAAGVISRYCIGGAVAAFLYIEPGTTYDLDIFIACEPAEGQLIVTLDPIFDYLKAKGYRFEMELIMIEDWPVQFLPPGNELVKEALDAAVSIDIRGVPTRVFSQEHLMAICLDVGRSKDFSRLVQFVEKNSHDAARFMDIIRRAGLKTKWERFKDRFLTAL